MLQTNQCFSLVMNRVLACVTNLAGSTGEIAYVEHLAVSTGEIALVYVAIIAGGISAYSASIAKKNGGISPTWSISLVLLAGLLSRCSCWRHPWSR